MKNNGLQNELDIVDLLNGKRLDTLPEFWIKLLHSIVPSANGDDVVICYKVIDNKKEDIVVKVHGCERSISVKCGDKVSVHCEKLSTFCGFLKSLGIEEKYINFLKLYQFGDGTLDGTGNYRLTALELKEKYKEEIKELNEVVNKPEILRRIILRFIAFGTPYQDSHVNLLYYGTVEGGIYSNMKWLCDFLYKKDYSHYKPIHFGPFLYQPEYRGLNLDEDDKDFEAKNRKRFYIEIKWLTIEHDMKEFNSTIKTNLIKNYMAKKNGSE